MARARVTKKKPAPAAPTAPRGKTRRERRKHSSRLLYRLGIALAIALPLLYFAFTKLLFNPFEDSQPAFPVLVPRDVEVFLHRERLDSDIDSFPRPRLYERLVATREWKELAGTEWFKGLGWPAQLEASFDEIEAQVAQAPLDPLADLAGREVAVVGRWDKPGGGAPEGGGEGGEEGAIGGADGGSDGGSDGGATRGTAQEPVLRTAMLLRISDWAKLLIEALDFDMVLNRALPGAELTTVDDPDDPGVKWHRLELPGQAPLYYARELDLLVVGQDEPMVRDVLRAVHAPSREASLGLTRFYLDNLTLPSGEADERLSLEVALDTRPLLPAPPPADQPVLPGPDAAVNLVRGLLDPTILRGVVARIEADESFSLRAHAELDAELAATHKSGLLGTPSFRASERLGEAFDHQPNDVSAVLTANLELKPLLLALSAALDPDFIQLLDGTLKDLARYNPGWSADDLPKLIDYLDKTLTGEITIAIRPLDHAIPKGSQPLPLLSFAAKVKDPDRWRRLDDAVVRGYKAFGIDGKQMFKQPEGVGDRKWLGLPPGLPIQEVAYILLDGTTAVITTDKEYLREIVAAYANNRASLGAEPKARAMLERLGDARANVAAWGSVEAVRGIMAPYAEYLSERDTILDLGPLRLQQKAELLQGEFREWLGKDDKMPDDVKAKLDAKLDELLGEMERKRVEEQVPVLAAAWREKWQWLSLFGSLAFALRLGERDADLSVQATTVLGTK